MDPADQNVKKLLTTPLPPSLPAHPAVAASAQNSTNTAAVENPFDSFENLGAANSTSSLDTAATLKDTFDSLYDSTVAPPSPPSAKTPQAAYAAIKAILGSTRDSGLAEIEEAQKGVDDPALQVFAAICKGILAANGDGVDEKDKAAALGKVSEKFSFLESSDARDTDKTNQKIIEACGAVAADGEINKPLQDAAHEGAKSLVTPIFQAALKKAEATSTSQSSPEVAASAAATTTSVPAPAAATTTSVPAPAAAATASAPTSAAVATPASAADHDSEADATATAAAVAKGTAALILALAAGPAGWALAAGFLYVTRNMGVKKEATPDAPPQEEMSEDAKKCVEAYEKKRDSEGATHSSEATTSVGAAAAAVVKDERVSVEEAARDLESTRTVMQAVDAHQVSSQQSQSSTIVQPAVDGQTPSPAQHTAVEVDAENLDQDQGKKPSLKERFANWRESRKAEKHQPLVEDDNGVEPADVAESSADAPDAASTIEPKKEKAGAGATAGSWRQKAGAALTKFGHMRLGEDYTILVTAIVVSFTIANPLVGASMAGMFAGVYVAKEIVQAGARAIGSALYGSGSGDRSVESGKSPDGVDSKAAGLEVSPTLTQEQSPVATPEASTPNAIDIARQQASTVIGQLRDTAVDADATVDSRATSVAGVRVDGKGDDGRG
jgi:hypothetical protein